jgi:predicted double-glycine peptidase
VLTEVARLMKGGWSAEGAAKAADYAVSMRYGKGGRKGIPDAQERAAFDIPLARWANAMGGKGGVGVRVPDTRQVTDYTCGPASLRAALGAFGIGKEEDDLAAAAGTTADGGTSAEGLAKAARDSGCEASVQENLTVDELVGLLEEGAVVVTCIQAWDSKGEADYDDYDASHWVVPVSIRDGAIECMDPSIDTARAIMPIEDFEERWHCINMMKHVNGLGLVLRGDEPANPTKIAAPVTPHL